MFYEHKNTKLNYSNFISERAKYWVLHTSLYKGRLDAREGEDDSKQIIHVLIEQLELCIESKVTPRGGDLTGDELRISTERKPC